MAKVKLLHFEIVSLLSDSKRIMDYIQKTGVAEIEDIRDDKLGKTDTAATREEYAKKYNLSQKAASIIERSCNIKKGLVESFTDFRHIDYSEFRALSDKVDLIESICSDIVQIDAEIEQTKQKINEQKRLIDFYTPWLTLDIPMASKRTLTTSIFIGTLNGAYHDFQISGMIKKIYEEIEEFSVEVISRDKMLTCAVVVAHKSCAEKVQDALRQIGFIIPEKVSSELVTKSVDKVKKEIEELENKVTELKKSLSDFADSYDNIRFLNDYSTIQIDKYEALENSAQTEKAFVIHGYLPEEISEEFKFEAEKSFICQIEYSEPDYDNPEVPVLIKNGSFAGGVESITNMYSPPSNKDVDPNPIMAFFYYVFFGFMLSDAGYGILMVLFSVIAKRKLRKSSSGTSKFISMVFYSGLSAVFWGALFGGWFGDLIPILFTEFLGYDKGPNLALWMDPVSNSMTLLLFSLGMGILQLFAGLLIRCYMLLKDKKYVSAFADTIPIIVFVLGFAVLGAGIIVEIPKVISELGVPLMAIGAALIILTGGRNSKSIIGKFGGGLYSLYTVATGYIGDILSYSRLLALSLVTGVVAGAVNMLAAMTGNIFIFVIIFIVGHVMNIAINLIGTYVHTNRLQYVEFFSKFYEGSGVEFKPLKLNSKHFIIKEEKKL